jgi:hypothetical protein
MQWRIVHGLYLAAIAVQFLDLRAAELAESANHEHVITRGDGMPEWSTDSVHPRESYSYWREAICKWVFNTSIEAPPGPFSARLASRASGPLRIAAGESSAYTLVRTRRELDAAPSDEYCIYLQRRSHGTIEQCDQSCTYQVNDVGLSDLRLPFRTMHADGG